MQSLFCLDRALAISSASRQLKISRAECLAFLGRYGEAQEVANDILRLDNINADAIYVRGLCLYNEDNVDKAFTHFQQVLRLAPDHVKAKEIYKVTHHSHNFQSCYICMQLQIHLKYQFLTIFFLFYSILSESKTTQTEKGRGQRSI